LPTTRSPLLGYLLAIAGTAIVLALTLVIPQFHADPFILFLFPAFFSAWLGGMRAAMLALLLSTICISLFFSPLFNNAIPLTVFSVTQFALFAFLTIGAMSLLYSRQHSANRYYIERERLRVTLSSIADGVIAIDNEGRITFLNEIAQRLTGWSPQEALSQPIGDVFSIIDEATRAAIDNPVLRAMRTGQNVATQQSVLLLTRDGSELLIENSASPIRAIDGGMMGAILVFRDSTERRRSERALHEANLTLQAIIDAAPLAITVFDRQGHVRLWSPAAERMTGFSQAEVIGKLPPTIPPPLVPEFNRMLEATARSKSIVSMETQRLRKDGALLDVMLITAALSDAHGEVSGFITISDDITDMKRARTSLRDSEQHLRDVLDSLFAFVGVMLPDGTLIEVNRAALEATGVTSDQVIGKPYDQSPWWSWSVDAQAVVRAVIEHSAQGERARFDAEIRTGSGERMFIDFMLAPMRGEDGEIRYLIPSAIDITARKHEEQFNLLLQTITASLSIAATPDQVAHAITSQIQEPLGAHLATIVSVNEEAGTAEILQTQGLPGDLVSRFRSLPLTHPGALTTAIRDRSPIWIETQDEYVTRFPSSAHIIRNETHSHASVCLPLTVGERVLGGLGISLPKPHRFSESERRFLLAVADQTALALERARLYEAEAAARHAAERADWLKTRFLAIVSHELRTPLASIKGFATTLLEEDVTWDAENQHEFITIISDEADKLAEMIDQLLDFSRLESGTLRIERAHITVQQILDFILPQLKMLSTTHDLIIDLPADLPTINADRRRIGQVITNLLVNAVRYSPPATAIIIGGSVHEAHVHVTITDHGPGIPPAERDSVFEPFRQGHLRPDGETKGAGLGLAIARGIVEAHQGRIWIEDRPGPGTTVCFALPIDLSATDDPSIKTID
jgi:PAS domain S-box-containing protein